MEIGEKIRDCDSDRVATDPVKEEKHERYRQSYAHHILVARGRCLRVFGALPLREGTASCLTFAFNVRHLNLRICRPTKLTQMAGREIILIHVWCVYVTLALGVREITK